MEKRDCLEAYFDKLLIKADELGNLCVHIADDRTVLSKLIWTAVKVYGQRDACEPKTKEYAERKFHSCKLITEMISLLTPEEFERVFPITKEYDGEKYGFKDYFSAKEALNKFKKGEPIFKSGDVDTLLWEYHNMDTQLFAATVMTCVDNVRKADGLPSVFEEFAENEGLNTYRKYTDVTTGKEFLIDKNRKTIPLSKPKAHNFKVIQGGKKGKNRKTKKRMIK